ncbi:hypothetical protein [Clostridium tetani]|uniref:hypothetical protein n=1 Tax=Clostridium tetani TaxID=1513 RepID=UPI0013E952E8|nr:hypothetical protein [Clostridium tetani]
MVLLMNLLNQNNNSVIYSFGIDENKLDGQIKISLDNPMDAKIIKESQYISNAMAMKGLIKLIRNIKNGEMKKFESYQS